MDRVEKRWENIDKQKVKEMSLTDFVSKIFAMDLTEQQRLLLEMYEEMKYIKSTTFYTPKELLEKMQDINDPNT